MSRNNHEWFKFEFRSWLESRRVQRMSLQAQALYLRALCVQALHGNVPSDPSDFALEAKVRESEVEAWGEVIEHFCEEEQGGCKFLYNQKLRDFLEAAAEKRETLSAIGKKGGRPSTKPNAKANGKANAKPKGLPKGKAKGSLRASYSNSLSLSKSLEDKQIIDNFSLFWAAYPNKQGKQKARESWEKHVTSDELAVEIIGHVQDRAKRDAAWLKDNGQYIPHPSTFLNQRRWEDTFQQVQPESRKSVVGGIIPRDEGAEYDILTGSDGRGW